MKLSKARIILGLERDEDLRACLGRLAEKRHRIVSLTRNAPNNRIQHRNRLALLDFDQALETICEHLGITKPDLIPETKPAVTGAAMRKPKTRRVNLVLTLVMIFAILGAVGFHFVQKQLAEQRAQERKVELKLELLERIANYKKQAASHVENRRWEEAGAAFTEIERLSPGSASARDGRLAIEQGIKEEQNQFIGYWTGQAIAELDAGRFDEAESATGKVLQKFPDEAEARSVLTRVAEARKKAARDAAVSSVRELLVDNKLEEAVRAAEKMTATHKDDGELAAMLAEAKAGLEKKRAEKERAMDLYQKAASRDRGEFDQKAMDWLREALLLAPEQPEIIALHEKMASYTRTLRVPGDFATPADALAEARPRDRIVIAGNTWKGPLVINVPVELQGAGPETTLVECPPNDGCALTIGPDAKGTRISGMTFRHEAFLAQGSERFAAALVRGGEADFVDCRFIDASGHGLAVVEQGAAVAKRCRFNENGWNGAAVMGQGSRMEIRDSLANGNFEHGVESWNGAALTLVNNRLEGNSRNGVHADNHGAPAVIEGNQLHANREFGLVLTSAGSGSITGNTARANLLGGFVVRSAASSIKMTKNQATENQGPGIVLEKGLVADSYRDNTSLGNQGTQILTDADLASGE